MGFSQTIRFIELEQKWNTSALMGQMLKEDIKDKPNWKINMQAIWIIKLFKYEKKKT